jgi:hypothetical protein
VKTKSLAEAQRDVCINFGMWFAPQESTHWLNQQFQQGSSVLGQKHPCAANVHTA